MSMRGALFGRVKRELDKRRNVRQAVLGNGVGAIDVPASRDKIFVRFAEGTDGNGQTVYSAPVPVYAGQANYITGDGVGVLVGRNWLGELAVVGQDDTWMRQVNVSPRVLNPMRPETKFVTIDMISIAMVRPVGTANTPSASVSAQPLFYYDDNATLRFFSGAQTSLSSFIPTAGNHAIVIVGLKTFDNVLQVTSSTQQALSSPLSKADYDEAIALFDDDVIPLQAFALQDAQTSVTPTNIRSDMRNIINTPRLEGNPMVAHTMIRIGAERQMMVAGQVQEIEGQYQVIGQLIEI